MNTAANKHCGRCAGEYSCKCTRLYLDTLGARLGLAYRMDAPGCFQIAAHCDNRATCADAGSTADLGKSLTRRPEHWPSCTGSSKLYYCTVPVAITCSLQHLLLHLPLRLHAQYEVSARAACVLLEPVFAAFTMAPPRKLTTEP